MKRPTLDTDKKPNFFQIGINAIQDEFNFRVNKKENLDITISWINKITETIHSDAAEWKNSDENQSPSFIRDGLNWRRYSQKDMQALKPALKQLYDACIEHDLSIEIQGFDLLPRDGVSAHHSFSTGSGNQLLIGMYYDQKLGSNIPRNPYYDSFDQELALAKTGKIPTRPIYKIHPEEPSAD